MDEDKFGKMKVMRGFEHEILGMMIIFKDGKAIVDMKKHILKVIDLFLDDITRDIATPVSNFLFKTRQDELLDNILAENFHSVVALLFFVSRHCRLDIQVAIAFLCTRVSNPNVDDWKKLKRVLQYLRETIDLKLHLGADGIESMHTWVDVSYAVHEDCKSHTGRAMSWGWGVLLTMCKKKNSTPKVPRKEKLLGLVTTYLT